MNNDSPDTRGFLHLTSFEEKAFTRIDVLFARTPIVILASYGEILIDCNAAVAEAIERGKLTGKIQDR